MYAYNHNMSPPECIHVIPGTHLDASNWLLTRVGRRGGRLEGGEMES